MIPVSVAIITLNEEARILRCLRSVKSLAAEIVVVDSGSTDNTVALCRDFGCNVFTSPFAGFSAQKQFAVDQASNDWVLVMDADEEVSPALSEEIRYLFGNQEVQPAGFLIPRRLCYMGRIMKHSGVGKEYILRLFDRRKGKFDGKPVHESIVTTGETALLKEMILHYSFHDLHHHLEKMNQYTTLAAEDYRKKGRSFSPFWVVIKFPVTFFTFYFLKLGILDGFAGFTWSWMAAVHTSMKIAKTIELQKR